MRKIKVEKDVYNRLEETRRLNNFFDLNETIREVLRILYARQNK